MQRRRRKIGKLVFVLFLFFFTILVVLFFQSSISKIQTIEVHGIEKLTSQEIIEQSGIVIGEQILLVRESKVQEALLQHPLIKEVELEIHFPGSISLHITEFKTVAYLFNHQHRLHPILESGYVFEQEHTGLVDHPIISEWGDLGLMPNMSKELSQLNSIILQQISEIRHVPTENDPYKLTLYMRDGYEVHTSIVQFAKHLNNYMYVVENLEQHEPGVINLSDAGVYYISYQELKQSLQESMEAKDE